MSARSELRASCQSSVQIRMPAPSASSRRARFVFPEPGAPSKFVSTGLRSVICVAGSASAIICSAVAESIGEGVEGAGRILQLCVVAKVGQAPNIPAMGFEVGCKTVGKHCRTLTGEQDC